MPNSFLRDLPRRPLNIANSRGTVPVALFLGNGPNALEVAVLESTSQPTVTNLRAIWKDRLAGRATPLLVVCLHGAQAALCGPAGDVPPAFGSLDADFVERVCRTALREPDRNAALRFLATAIPESEAPLPGIRNEGLFATHELRIGPPNNPLWPRASVEAQPLLAQRGEKLLERLGYSIEAATGPVSILRAGENRRAVAVFLDRDESPDLPSARFAQLSPVSYALARAGQENLDWVIVSAGPVLRLHPVGTDIGTGRRSRTDTYAEIHLDLIAPSDAAYLWFLFSADALKRQGTVEELLANSSRYAAELGVRLRERIYSDVVPDLAMGILAARGLRRAKPEDLADTYQMTLVYLFRLLFLAYAEDKELLPYKHNTLYRDRSLKHKAQELAQIKRDGAVFGADSALWEEIDRLFKAVDKGNATWGVPAYNGGLFSRDAAVSPLGDRLTAMSLSDNVLGPVLTGLLVEHTPEGWGPVDFRSLGVREFGTIYEGLLENELAIAEEDLTTKTKEKQYAPAGPRDTVVVSKGRAYLYNTSGARKSTGSYFTKHFAVEHLLQNALEPALQEHCARLNAMSAGDAAKAFFDFRVADLAMGSGHFLVAAVDRIERALSTYLVDRPLKEVHTELARLRQSAELALGPVASVVTLEDTQLLRRQIARRCIYGVDINPMAVDLARLAIWIHTFVPGLPLSFLDHNLVQGNALVGIGTLHEANECLAEFAGPLFVLKPEELEPALDPLQQLAGLSDANSAEITKARKAFAEALNAVAPVAALFDILSAARLDKECGESVHQDASRWMRELGALPGSPVHQRARQILKAIPPFHFPVAFPEVFLRSRSGFDVLLGNPPWEEARLEEVKFWMRHRPRLVSAAQRERQEEIDRLRRDRPDLLAVYLAEKAEADLLRSALTSGQYPGMGTGNPDVYKAFYWRFWELLATGTGWAGIVLPRSAMYAKGSTEFRQHAFGGGQFFDLTWLTNTRGWVFDDVHPQYTIVLAAFAKRPPTINQDIPLRGPFRSLDRYLEGVKAAPLRFTLDEVGSWTDTWALPLLPTEESGDAFAQMRKLPRLDSTVNGWRARAATELHASGDKGLMHFVDEPPEGYWPILKGESFDIWEPDGGACYAFGDPQIIVPALQAKRLRSARLGSERSAFAEFPERWSRDLKTLPCRAPRIVFRDVSRAGDTRTMRTALIPGKTFLCHLAPYFLWPRGDESDQAFLLGVLCSLPLDWYARRFVENHMTYTVLDPFPIPRPLRSSPLWQRVVALAGRLAAPDARFAAWAQLVGVTHGTINSEEKEAMIWELDAVVAHLYGLNARQLRAIYETFHEGWAFEEQLSETLKYFEFWKNRI